jgi:hypothetical protein
VPTTVEKAAAVDEADDGAGGVGAVYDAEEEEEETVKVGSMEDVLAVVVSVASEGDRVGFCGAVVPVTSCHPEVGSSSA